MRDSWCWLKRRYCAGFCCRICWALVSLKDDTCQLDATEGAGGRHQRRCKLQPGPPHPPSPGRPSPSASTSWEPTDLVYFTRSDRARDSCMVFLCWVALQGGWECRQDPGSAASPLRSAWAPWSERRAPQPASFIDSQRTSTKSPLDPCVPGAGMCGEHAVDALTGDAGGGEPSPPENASLTVMGASRTSPGTRHGQAGPPPRAPPPCPSSHVACTSDSHRCQDNGPSSSHCHCLWRGRH